MSTSRFLSGALVGVVIGLLIAPEKGEELRENIAETADQWKKKINKIVGKSGAELADLKNLLEEQIEGLNDDVRHRILTILDESGETAENIKDHVSNGLKA